MVDTIIGFSSSRVTSQTDDKDGTPSSGVKYFGSAPKDSGHFSIKADTVVHVDSQEQFSAPLGLFARIKRFIIQLFASKSSTMAKSSRQTTSPSVEPIRADSLMNAFAAGLSQETISEFANNGSKFAGVSIRYTDRTTNKVEEIVATHVKQYDNLHLWITAKGNLLLINNAAGNSIGELLDAKDTKDQFNYSLTSMHKYIIETENQQGLIGVTGIESMRQLLQDMYIEYDVADRLNNPTDVNAAITIQRAYRNRRTKLKTLKETNSTNVSISGSVRTTSSDGKKQYVNVAPGHTVTIPTKIDGSNSAGSNQPKAGGFKQPVVVTDKAIVLKIKPEPSIKYTDYSTDGLLVEVVEGKIEDYRGEARYLIKDGRVYERTLTQRGYKFDQIPLSGKQDLQNVDTNQKLLEQIKLQLLEVRKNRLLAARDALHQTVSSGELLAAISTVRKPGDMWNISAADFAPNGTLVAVNAGNSLVQIATNPRSKSAQADTTPAPKIGYSEFYALAQATDGIHRAGYIHGDIKPHNVCMKPRVHLSFQEADTLPKGQEILISSDREKILFIDRNGKQAQIATVKLIGHELPKTGNVSQEGFDAIKKAIVNNQQLAHLVANVVTLIDTDGCRKLENVESKVLCTIAYTRFTLYNLAEPRPPMDEQAKKLATMARLVMDDYATLLTALSVDIVQRTSFTFKQIWDVYHGIFGLGWEYTFSNQETDVEGKVIPMSECKIVIQDTAIQLIEQHVKPEFKNKVRQLLTDPTAYAEQCSKDNGYTSLVNMLIPPSVMA